MPFCDLICDSDTSYFFYLFTSTEQNGEKSMWTLEIV